MGEQVDHSSEYSPSCETLTSCSLIATHLSLLVFFPNWQNDLLLLPPDFPHTPALHTSSTSILTSTVNLLCPHRAKTSRVLKMTPLSACKGGRRLPRVLEEPGEGVFARAIS